MLSHRSQATGLVPATYLQSCISCLFHYSHFYPKAKSESKLRNPEMEKMRAKDVYTPPFTSSYIPTMPTAIRDVQAAMGASMGWMSRSAESEGTERIRRVLVCICQVILHLGYRTCR